MGNKKSKIFQPYPHVNPIYGSVDNPFQFAHPIQLVVNTSPIKCKNTTKKFSKINQLKFGTDSPFKLSPKLILQKDERSIAGKTILDIIEENNFDLLENFIVNNNVHQTVGHAVVLLSLECNNIELLKFTIKHRLTMFLRMTTDSVVMGHWMYWLDLTIEKEFEKELLIYIVKELCCYHLTERI